MEGWTELLHAAIFFRRYFCLSDVHCSLFTVRKAEEVTGYVLIVLFNVDMFWYFFSKSYLFHKTNQYFKS